MGFESAPLLQPESCLSPHQREKIFHTVLRRLNLLRVLVPVCGILCLLLSLALLVLIAASKFNAGIVLRSIFPLFTLIMNAIGCFFYFQHIGRMQQLANDMFGESYVGSWLYEEHSWKPFARYHYQLKGLLLGIVLGCCIFFILGGFGLWLGLWFGVGSSDPGLMFTYTALPFIAVGIILFGWIQGVIWYHIHRKYDPTVHSCILARGGLYAEGSFYPLQPATAAKCTALMNLQSVSLQEQEIAPGQWMNLLKLTMNSSAMMGEDKLRLVECPVPNSMLQSVKEWVRTFSNGFTTTVYISPSLVNVEKKTEVPPVPSTQPNHGDIDNQ